MKRLEILLVSFVIRSFIGLGFDSSWKETYLWKAICVHWVWKSIFLQKRIIKTYLICYDKVMDFCCDICSKTFGRKEHLTRHTKHIQEENHEENIEMCESYFRKEQSLKLHICLCTKMGKNFVCDASAKSFPRKTSFDRHITDIHEQSGESCMSVL